MPKLAPAIQSPAVIESAFKAGKKTLTDGGQEGLYIEFKRRPGASINTGHPWRFNYKRPGCGRNNRLTFGNYPTVGLAKAREEAAKARALLADKVDPALVRDAAAGAVKAAGELARENDKRAAEGVARIGTFADYAGRYVESRLVAAWTASYANEALTALKAFAFPLFGDKPIGDVTSLDIKAFDDLMIGRGKRTMHLKARRFVFQVFAWAMHPARGMVVKANPVYPNDDLYIGIDPTPRASIVSIVGQEIGAERMTARVKMVVQAITSWRPQSLEWAERGLGTRNAMLLGMWTLQRVTTIVQACKNEFDLDAGTWVIPADKMKGRRQAKTKKTAKAHTVHLPWQAVAMLREQFAMSGPSAWVFPGQRNGKSGHMNRSTPNGALNRLGFQGEHSMHGFRAMGRTAGDEIAGLDPVLLERVLAHAGAKNAALHGGMPGVYDRTAKLEGRAKLVQDYADWLDSLIEIEPPKLRLVA